jgi:phosphatidate cytidylyltransferase
MEGSRVAGRRSRGEERQGRRRGGGGSDTRARVLAAVPAIAFAIFIVSRGGLVFTVAVILLAIVAMGELFGMMERVRPAAIAAFLAVAAMCLAAFYGDQYQVLLALVASVPVTFVFSLLRPQRDHIAWAMAAVILAIVWIGLPFAHAVLLREHLDHGGGLLLDVLIGTFLSDTCAYFVGRAWGSRPIAPRISPNKTLEGLLGGILGGTFFFWFFAIAYQHDWFKGPDALLIGFCVALAAPLGDLFESAIKRDLDVKDAGRFFGAHGGVLDRLDGVLFSVVVAYYVSHAVLG